MDGYRDLYRAPVAAGYYATRYGVDGPSSYSLSVADPLLSAYARVPVDAYAAAVSRQPELLPFHRYGPSLRPLSPRRHTVPRRRPFSQTGFKRWSLPVQNLGPNKTRFKKTQKSSHAESSTPKKGRQRTASKKMTQQKEQKVGDSVGEPQKSPGTSLAKETQELHSLFRTGVDSATGKTLVQPSAKKAKGTSKKNPNASVTPQKRKADAQKQDEAPSSTKRPRRKRNKKLAKKKNQEVKTERAEVSTPKAVKVEPPVLTEEEAKEVEASLALQIAVCKAVGEFLGIPEVTEETKKSEALDASTEEVKPEDAQLIANGEVQVKSEKASKAVPLTPDEEKELEEKGYKFFSKVLEENQDIRNLYLDKKDAGTFECLICRSTDPGTSKKFANLTNLVMHTSMRKQNRPEHRGYGHAICDVLGWETLKAPKQPAKQVKEQGDSDKQLEVEKRPEEKPGDNEGVQS